MYGQGQLAEQNFFFKMLSLRFKNVQIYPSKFRNSNQPEVWSNWAYWLESWGVISVKNAQILKILRGQKWEVSGKIGIKYLWGLSGVLKLSSWWICLVIGLRNIGFFRITELSAHFWQWHLGELSGALYGTVNSLTGPHRSPCSSRTKEWIL